MGSGVKAKTTTTPSTPDSFKNDPESDVTVCFGGKQYQTGKKATSDSKSVKSLGAGSIAGCTFNGKEVAAGGTPMDPNIKVACLVTECRKFIDGCCVLTECDGWLDVEGNSRASLRVHVGSMLELSKESINMRTSTRVGHENICILQFKLSSHFTVPDKVLNYLIPSIQRAHGCDKLTARQLLRMHPRYAALTKHLNEMKEIAKKCNGSGDLLCEVRVHVMDSFGKPMPVHNQLVSEKEDAIFHSYHAEEDGSGGTNMFFEFRAASRPFKAVQYNVVEEDATIHGSVKLPSSINFRSPAVASRFRNTTPIMECDEDNSSISSKESESENEESFHSADLKTPSASKKRRTEDADDDIENLSVNLSGMTMKQLSKIVQQAQDKMVERVIQQSLSNDDSKATPPKKKKNGSGDASVAGASVGNATRGSRDREEKRKVSTGRNNVDDDVSMARSVHSHHTHRSRSSHGHHSVASGKSKISASASSKEFK